jgi:PII-like signaling protein
MKREGEMTLLRVHVRSSDRHGWFSAAAAVELVNRARAQGLAGATVLEGFYGLDVTGTVLERSDWSLVQTVPVIVEVVDTPAAIGRFLGTVGEVVPEGVATLERAHVLLYRIDHPSSGPALLRTRVPGAVSEETYMPSAREFPAMQLAEDGRLLRVFIGEDDRWEGQPLYRVIVLKAKELGLAGATVLKGSMSFGANSRVHTSRLVELSADLPVVIEIVDAPEKIEVLLPFLDGVVREGLITVENVRVLRYRHNPDKGSAP